MVKENTMKQTEIGLLPEDWEVIRLGDYVSLKNGYAFPSLDFSDIGPIVMTPGNFRLEGGLKFNADKVIRFKGAYTKNMQFSNGDLVMVMTDLTPDCNLLGKAGIIDTDEVVLHNQRIGKIECSKNVHSKYLSYYFNSETFSARMKNTATGSTVRHTSTPTIKNTILSLPPLPEQEAIAEALSDADAWIERLEQLIAKKRLIKQGAMQELLTPKEDWEVKKLGDLTKIFTKQTGFDYSAYIKPSLVRIKTDETIPFIQNKDFKNKWINLNTDYFIPKSIALNFPKIVLNEKALLVSISGSVGNVGVYDLPDLAFIGGAVAILKFKDPLLIDWVSVYLQSDAGQIKLLNNVKSGSHQNLILDDIRKIEILFPDFPEQTRIATILSDMDAELEALEGQLGKARKVKQGMMQELLTGRVRFV